MQIRGFFFSPSPPGTPFAQCRDMPPAIISSGFIAVVSSEDHKSAAAVEVLCDTPSAAQSLPVINLASHAAKLLLHNPRIDIAAVGEHNLNTAQAAHEVGQGIHFGRSVVLSNPAGRVEAYAPHSGNLAVLISLTGEASDRLAHDLCLHVVTHVPPPIAVSRKDLPRAVTGDYALMDQRFVRNPAKTLAQVLYEAGCRVEQFVRLEPGR
jgi:translation elongation factor EF-Ts